MCKGRHSTSTPQIMLHETLQAVFAVDDPTHAQAALCLAACLESSLCNICLPSVLRARTMPLQDSQGRVSPYVSPGTM